MVRNIGPAPARENSFVGKCESLLVSTTQAKMGNWHPAYNGSSRLMNSCIRKEGETSERSTWTCAEL
jgi:hypothetical protein